MLPQERRINHTHRATLHAYIEIMPLISHKPWLSRGKVDRAGGGKILGSLKDCTLLPIIERDRLHILQRESAKIHHTILRITNLQTIVKDAHVMTPHTAHINSL